MQTFVSTFVLSFLFTSVSSHSFLTCLDNGGLEVDSLVNPSTQNPCIGYPRGRGKFNQDGDKALASLMTPSHSCGAAFGSEYDHDYPLSYLIAGSPFYPEWAARNNAGPQAGNVKFYLSPKDITSDPSPKEFEEKMICQISFSNCNMKLGPNEAPCTGQCVLPSDVLPGKYVIQWRWESNEDEIYTSCADIEVVEGRVERGWTKTTTKSATTSSSSTTKVSSTTKGSTSTTKSGATSNSNGNTDSSTTDLGDFILPDNNTKSNKDGKDFWSLTGILMIVFAGLFAITLAALVTLYITKVRNSSSPLSASSSSSSSSESSYPPPPSMEISASQVNLQNA